jgi:hypothetical protein
VSIRLRTVDGVRVALCAAETDPRPGDTYLDDADHYALAAKFAQDHRTGIEYPHEWAAMATQKVRDAREELDRWIPPSGVSQAGRYLTPAEKARELEGFERSETPDEGIRPLMAQLNRIADVCTVQSCIGHRRRANGSVYVESAHVEMRLGERATKAFYDAMPRLKDLPFVEDAILSLRPGYQVASVWGTPGSLPAIVDQLALVLAPQAETDGASEEAACA